MKNSLTDRQKDFERDLRGERFLLGDDVQLSWKQKKPFDEHLGPVMDFLNEGRSDLGRLLTGEGVLFPHTMEVYTPDVANCIVPVLSGPQGRALFHMTPCNRLAWTNREEHRGFSLEASVAHIVGHVRSLAPELAQLKMTVFANSPYGTDSEPVKEERIRTEWARVIEKFQEAGVSEARLIELPMTSTTLYCSPERPEEIFAIGYKVARTEKLVTRVEGIQSEWITLLYSGQTGPLVS